MFFKAILTTGISSGLQYFGRWLLNILLANILTVAAFGKVSTLIAVANMLGVAFAVGAPLHSFISRHKSWEQDLSISFFFVGCGLIVCIPLCVALGLWRGNFFEILGPVLLAAIFAIAQIVVFSLRARAQLSADMLINGSIFVGMVSAPIMIFVLGISTPAAVIWMMAGTAGLSVLAVIGLSGIPVNWHAIVFPRIPGRGYLGKRFTFLFGDLTAVAIANLPVLLLASISTTRDVALFRANYGLLMPLLLVAVVFSQSALLSLSLVNEDRQYSVMIGILFLVSIAGVFLGALYYILAPHILPMIFHANQTLANPGEKLTFYLCLLIPLWFVKSALEALVSKIMGGRMRFFVNSIMVCIILSWTIFSSNINATKMVLALLLATSVGVLSLFSLFIRSSRRMHISQPV